MSDAAYKTLVARYAAGRTICNCGLAYETPFTAADRRMMRDGEWAAGSHCAGGCSAAMIDARDEIAEHVLESRP